MSASSIELGTCPKCGAADVYTDRELSTRGNRSRIHVGGMGPDVDTYVCLTCGHFEELFPKRELERTAARIRAAWKKV